MNNIKNIIFTIICVASFTACNDMEQEPTNSYTDKNFWTSVEKAQYVLNMAYNQLYSAGQMWNDERLSDNVFQGRSFTDQRTIRNGIADASTGIFSGEWSSLYGGIKTCHIFLKYIDNIKASETVKNNMKAQIRFIRASLFFRLTNFYGDIPFFTEDITFEQSKTINRTSRATVIKFIHEELDDILQYLPTKEQLTENERGKITKGAAVMLQARAYMYDGDFTNTEKYCAMLINEQDTYGHYSLFGNYKKLFTQDNEYNEEVIMDCCYVPSTRTWGEMYDMVPLSVGGRVNSTAPTQSLVDNYIMLDGKPAGESTMYNANTPYRNRDPRLTASVVYDGFNWSSNISDGSTGKVIHIKPSSADKTDAYQGQNANQTSTGYYICKYYDVKHETNMESAINIITMRYADVLLMYAEAMNEQNKMTAEVWDNTVKAIRRRAGFTKAEALDYPAGQDQAAMRKTLRNERRSELAFEGLRWYDIKRWKAGTEYLNGYVYGAPFGTGGTNIRLDNYKFLETRDYLWSVPQSQMDINNNLRPNNPGYSN